jgi:hypothetical protein
MAGKYKTSVQVNRSPLELNEFVEGFIAEVAIAMVKTLKGVDYIRKVEYHQEKDDVAVVVNGEDIQLTPFPIGIINSTLLGMMAPLKGTDNMERLDIVVEV